jgi:Pectinesterase
LIGESVEHTIITFDDYNPKVKGTDTVNTWNSFTFAADAEGFIAENITFENTAGRVGQAVALRVNADKVIFRNCRFLGTKVPDQEQISKKGGGTVIIPEGLWLTGPIALKSNINLHAENGALVLFTSDYDEYPMVKTWYEGLNCWRTMSPETKKAEKEGYPLKMLLFPIAWFIMVMVDLLLVAKCPAESAISK